MDVGTSDRDTQRDSLAVGQHRPLGADFATIRWVFASFFTPQRSFGHGSVHGLPSPFNSQKFVVFLEGSSSQHLENTSFNEALKIPMQGTSRTKLRWDGFSLAAGPQDIKDTVEDLTVGQRRPPAFPISPALRQ
jgi:hypothetical protein